ncbi:MAG: aminoglycoside phosphotransferase family protein [Bacteroidota bacterium]
MESIPLEVLSAYGFESEGLVQQSFGTGLINHTWKIQSSKGDYILQTINQNVFPDPQAIANNIDAVGDYLQKNYPDYFFVHPIQTKAGYSMVCFDNEYYRMFPFVMGSHAKTVVDTASEAYEAAKQFGIFTKLLSGFNIKKLGFTLPDFHNLTLRYQQFEEALISGDLERIKQSKQIIQKLIKFKTIVKIYQSILMHPDFKKRVTHHDTKISNILFNDANQGICVIDLDTLMPGLFISDVGDMMRTYLCPVSEEETDLTKITIRTEIYQAIVNGYSDAMGDELTKKEKQHFFYAAQFMIYMQALRFLTDHLNNDRYYGAKYEGQNFVRAANQIKLLEKLTEKESILT